MSSSIPTIPTGAHEPAKVYPKPPVQPLPVSSPKLTEHHAATPTLSTALSPTDLSTADVSYVDSLLGTLPAQKMEEILLRTGVPVPANLGPNIDTSA